jgi:hypothetical protein
VQTKVKGRMILGRDERVSRSREEEVEEKDDKG